MSTTIQVSQTTKQLLDIAKKNKQAPSYDQVIEDLLKKDLKVPKSMFGSTPGLSWNKKEDRMKFHHEL